VLIFAPADGSAFAPQSLVEFEGSAYDVDDGILDGDAIAWTSSLDGALGNGAVLATTSLRTGTHMITMRATDSDGNTASAAVTVRIAGAAPGLDLLVAPLDTLPTRCVEATISPHADPGGVGLALVQYSLDGGATWTDVPLNRLPYKFRVPGSGFVHLVARVVDQAGQVTARDAKFFIDSACAQSGPPRIDGAVGAKGTAAPGVVFVDVVLSNRGQDVARALTLAGVTPRTLAGSGAVTYDASRSPALPRVLPDLAPGASTTVRLFFNVPAGVRRFALTENGSLRDSLDRTFRFSINQSVLP